MIDGEATVKRYFPEGDVIRFQPANSNMQPIIVRKATSRASTSSASWSASTARSDDRLPFVARRAEAPRHRSGRAAGASAWSDHRGRAIASQPNYQDISGNRLGSGMSNWNRGGPHASISEPRRACSWRSASRSPHRALRSSVTRSRARSRGRCSRSGSGRRRAAGTSRSPTHPADAAAVRVDGPKGFKLTLTTPAGEMVGAMSQPIQLSERTRDARDHRDRARRDAVVEEDLGQAQAGDPDRARLHAEPGSGAGDPRRRQRAAGALRSAALLDRARAGHPGQADRGARRGRDVRRLSRSTDAHARGAPVAYLGDPLAGCVVGDAVEAATDGSVFDCALTVTADTDVAAEFGHQPKEVDVALDRRRQIDQLVKPLTPTPPPPPIEAEKLEEQAARRSRSSRPSPSPSRSTCRRRRRRRRSSPSRRSRPRRRRRRTW